MVTRVRSEKALPFQDFDLVTIGISDKSHLALAGGEFFPPLSGPDFNTLLLKLIAVGDDVRNSHRGVHQVLRKGDVKIR